MCELSSKRGTKRPHTATWVLKGRYRSQEQLLGWLATCFFISEVPGDEGLQEEGEGLPFARWPQVLGVRTMRLSSGRKRLIIASKSSRALSLELEKVKGGGASGLKLLKQSSRKKISSLPQPTAPLQPK